jgi:glucose/arabinose dehydrogenase
MHARGTRALRLAPAPIVAALLGTLAATGAGTRPAEGSAAPPAGTRPAEGSPAPPAHTAQTPAVRLVRVATFRSPSFVTAPAGDRRRVFVTELGGRIMVIRGGRKLRRPFLDLSGQVSTGGERGLLSMAFAPDYATSRRFYVSYTDRSGHSRIVEYRRSRRSPDRADRSTRRTVLVQRQPQPNHNGGQIQFGPDRLLYAGLGDGGGQGDRHGTVGNAQDLGTRLGAILRIDPRAGRRRAYRVPGDNPFVARPGARPEIYAYGLRNPWRFSFDRATGAIAIADVGGSVMEEINFAPRGRARGANFGWRVWEGTTLHAPGERAPGHVPPVHRHSHAAGFCSITGGYVIRDPAMGSLRGRYVYGDFCDGRLRVVRLRRPRAEGARLLGPRVGRLTSFGEDARGRVYAASLAGAVYRLARR